MPRRASTALLTLALFGTPAASHAQSCDRVLGVSGEGVSWAVPASHPTPSEILASTSWDPDGNGPLAPWLIVAGNFDRAGDTPANNIAAWNGSTWLALGAGTNGRVKAVAVLGSRLYAAGDFTSAGGVADTNILARWTGSAWEPGIIGGSGQPVTFAPGSTLLDMDSDGSRIYICGVLPGYSIYGDDNIFSSNGSDIESRGCDSHIITGTFSGLDCPPGRAQAIEPRGLAMHVLCGYGARYPAEADVLAFSEDPFNGYNWYSLAGSSSITGVCLRYINGQYYFGGRAPDGTPALMRTYVASTNPFIRATTSVSVPSAGQGTVTAVTQLGTSGTGLACAIGYTTGSGQIQSSVFDRSTANPVILGSVIFNGRINDLFEHDGSLYAFGSFTQAGLRTCRGAARFNGTEWVPLIASGFDVYPFALASFGTALWAGGNFGTIAGQSIPYLARQINGVWQPITTPGPNGPVTALSFYNSSPQVGIEQSMIVGGIFSQAGTTPANNIANYRYTGGNLTISPMGSGVNGAPRVMIGVSTSINHNDLIIGGDFTTANGMTVNRIARWTGAAWQPLGSGMNGTVRALAVFGGQIIAGGSFTTAGGQSALSVAAWNGSGWIPMGAGLNDTVRALINYNGTLYAGGDFTLSGATSVGRFAKWNGSAWIDPGASLDDAVWSFRLVDSNLMVGGAFSDSLPGPIRLNHIGLWNGTAFRRFNQGIDNTVVALATNGADVYASATVPPYIFRATPANPPSVDVWRGTASCLENMNIFNAQSACDGAQFTWRRNGQALPEGVFITGGIAVGTRTSQLIVYPFGADDSGTFDCQILCPCGAATSDPIYVEFSTPPRILAQPTAGTFCTGESQQLSILADGAAPITYTWLRNGVPFLSTSNPVVTLDNQSQADAGSYSCQVSNGCGSVTSQSVQRTVVPAPVITLQPQPVAACTGRAVTFSAAATSAAGATVRWYRNNIAIFDRPASAAGAAISGSGSYILNLSQLTAADAGFYVCRITTGCATITNQAQLTITTAACCPADFNNSGGLSVQDLFDFLTAYFTNQPTADFNASGNISVQDIFDYLTAYFAGC